MIKSNSTFILFLCALVIAFAACSLAIAQTEPSAQETPLPYKPPRLKLIAPPVLPAVTPEVIFHGLRNAKLIALTFDACSTQRRSYYDERVTQVLVEKKVPATIFLGGKWIEDNLDHAKYLASLPQFELGNHTFLHPHLTKVSDARVREEITWTQAILFTVTGRQASLLRPPYGEYDNRVVEIAANKGLTTIQYDLASGDPDERITKDQLSKYVIDSAQPGAIVVMHINRHGWHTAEALPDIIDSLRKKGFIFVTVGDLLSKIRNNQ